MSNAKLIYDSPERNADLYYATHFWAPDDILFLEHKGKKFLVLSDLELERGKKEAKVHKVLALADLAAKARKAGRVDTAGIIETLLKDFGIRKIGVPHKTPFVLVDALRKKGFRIEAGDKPFYLGRTFKTAREKKWMIAAQKVTFQAIGLAEKILRASTVRRGTLYWKGKVLTSERVRFELDRFLLERGYRTKDIIIACGLQGTDPHCTGSGPLKANEAIIVDVFPRNDATAFHGDATRTFCKGKASPELKKMYAAVKAAQENAIKKIRGGVNGKTIHDGIMKYFESRGFKTGTIDGAKQGFIHGTGHGIGLEIHEEPVRINTRDFILKPGHVVTVEPGLYYRKNGGVRLEDIVFVTQTGCELFSTYPKRLEID